VDASLDSPHALAVRSVAVHPTDSSIVLRAGGAIVNNTLKSGLWRSTNGGETWKLVTEEIDFDGRGPTTTFGEVVAFSFKDPNLAAAGGETKGLFVSEDAGETWKCVGLTGERITCLGFNPYRDDTLAVGTFADAEFDTLGLGKPWSAVAAPARVYRYNRGAQTAKCFEADNFGVTNVRFDNSHGYLMQFATTRGVYYISQGRIWQRRFHIPADTLYTALESALQPAWHKVFRYDDCCVQYAAPFSGTRRIPLYMERTMNLRWTAVDENAQVHPDNVELKSGLSCIVRDREEEDTLYVCNRYGILKSRDNGRSYRLVYSLGLSD
jgi:hypothetical protein